MEAEFWTVLLRIARERGQTLSALVATVDATREPGRPLASALRVTALLANAPASSAAEPTPGRAD